MKALGINGSPHENGNTAYALAHALGILEKNGIQTRSIWLGDKEIKPCRGCFSCMNGPCAQEDDMRVILDAMRCRQGLLLASPVYMGMVTGPMKTMMDRSVPLRIGPSFEMSGKPAGGIACGGFRNGGQELTLQCMHTLFLQQDMMAVADGPPFSHSGATIVGEAKDDALGLSTVRHLALRLARALGIERPTA